jgi:hypothetical protein
MKRRPLRRRVKLRARKPLRRSSSLQRTPSMAATDAQRAAVAGRCCIVCGADRRIDPAHLIPVRWAGVATRFASPLSVVGATARMIAASWTSCRTWSRPCGRSSRTPWDTWG